MMEPDSRLWLLDAMETEINIFTIFLCFILCKCTSNNAWQGYAVIECAVQSLLFVA